MRRLMVVGNWKCNGSLSFAQQYTKDVLNTLEFDPNKVEVVISPAALHIPEVQKYLENYIHLAAQNIALFDEGHDTGEISIQMLIDLGIRHTYTGHMQRRYVHGESDWEAAVKTKRARDAGLTAIVCIGESQEDRNAGETSKVLRRQLNAILKECGMDWTNIVVAYEPQWTTVTGVSLQPALIEEDVADIRQWIEESISPVAAKTVRVLYGGCVSPDNASEIIKIPDVDGFLVGGAALDTRFHKIVAAAQDAPDEMWLPRLKTNTNSTKNSSDYGGPSSKPMQIEDLTKKIKQQMNEQSRRTKQRFQTRSMYTSPVVSKYPYYSETKKSHLILNKEWPTQNQSMLTSKQPYLGMPQIHKTSMRMKVSNKQTAEPRSEKKHLQLPSLPQSPVNSKSMPQSPVAKREFDILEEDSFAVQGQ